MKPRVLANRSVMASRDPDEIKLERVARRMLAMPHRPREESKVTDGKRRARTKRTKTKVKPSK
jgi:hypothetical protein